MTGKQQTVREVTTPVNSLEYWDQRFSENWDLRGGRRQSRSFMELLVRSLSLEVVAEIAGGELSILDCGCAKGDGTAVLAERFPTSRVGGFDFSAVAIEEAQQSYTDLEFFVSGFEELSHKADVLVSSHCFEHLSDPLRALRHLMSRAGRYVILLVPFREAFPPDPEHRWIIHGETFPKKVGAWRLTHRIILPPIPVWAQAQLLLIYEPGARIRGPNRDLPQGEQLDSLAQAFLAVSSLHRLSSELDAFRSADGPFAKLVKSSEATLTQLEAVTKSLEALVRSQADDREKSEAAPEQGTTSTGVSSGKDE